MLAGSALAGSPVWESSVRPQDPHTVEVVPVDAAGYAITSNATHSPHWRRWVSITSDPANRLWPDRTITYCFDSQQAFDKLANLFIAATEKWYVAGLNRLAYHYKRLDEIGEKCINHKNRGDIMVVSYNFHGVLATSLGSAAPDQSMNFPGPFMRLSDLETVGMLNKMSNVAHEIGHAWGLTHEHQNPYLWSKENINGRGDKDKAPFAKDAFVCENLADYGTIQQNLRDKGLDPELMMLSLCTNRRQAQGEGFSAMEWLPIMETNIKFELTKPDVGMDDVDWRSIMLYPSGAGGSGNAAPPGQGQDPGINDHRNPVLIRRGSTPQERKIPINLEPSRRDIEGINQMYDDPTFPRGSPVLINNPKHPRFEKFKNMFNKKKC